MPKIQAYAAKAARGRIERWEYDPGALGPEQVEIAVESCGLCHSDLTFLNNDLGMSTYPFVGGHEVIGKVAAIGDNVKSVTVGQRVGLGWFSRSCLMCRPCLSGDLNLCTTVEQTIIGRHGGFADRVRAQATWVLPLPEAIDAAKAGPLFCGGTTVFNPLLQFDVKPTDRVGVVGIGGLGHLALMFLKAWGCDVVAFTSESKKGEAIEFGATQAVSSRDPSTFAKLQGSLDFLLVTATASLDWQAYLNCLGPKGRLHFVGITPDPISTSVLPLIFGQRSISGSPLGSPLTAMKMLDFAARHHVAPVTETFPMSQINEAVAHLASGKAHYRVVLTNDFN